MSFMNKFYKYFLDGVYIMTNGYSGVRYHTCPYCGLKFHRWCSTDSVKGPNAYCSMGCAYVGR